MDLDSDEDSASYPRSSRYRTRQGRQGMSSFKSAKQNGRMATSRKNGAAKQPTLEGGYDTNPFDAITDLRAMVPGLSGGVPGQKKKRSFFLNPALPPIIPGNLGKAPPGKANHHQAIKLSAIRIADGGDGAIRSRVGSPVS